MIVNYDSRVVPDLKIPHITTDSRVVIYDHRGFIRLAAAGRIKFFPKLLNKYTKNILKSDA